jgi:L-threonylcarbamoyladenylate synthase
MFDRVNDQLQQPAAIGVIPTDTVYGVIARAADRSAVARLYELKKRDDKPGTLIAANIQQLEDLGLKHRYLKAVEQFWPGAVSVVIPAANPELGYLHRGKMSLAVRIPKHPELQALLQRTGPLLTSSANHPGEPTAATAHQARNYFGKQVDFYVDGGDLSRHLPSTIIRVVDDAIVVLRPGAVKVDDDTISP